MADAVRQPLLHDLVTCLAAPTAVLSGQDGQVRADGAQGALVADVRVLSRAELTVDGAEPEPVTVVSTGPSSAEFIGLVRSLGDDIADPTVWVRRARVAGPAGCAETITLVNVAAEPVTTTVELRLAADMAQIETVKVGAAGRPMPFRADSGGFLLRAAGVAARISATGRVGATASGGTDRVQEAAPLDGAGRAVGAAGAQAVATADGGVLRWAVTVPPRGRASVGWALRVTDSGAVVIPAAGPSPFVPPTVVADDRRLAPFVTRAVQDLSALRMCTAQNPGAQFLAAGSPWYLTLFGRDSIWAARMLLPLGTDIAEGTLRALASRQGTTSDPVTAEEPGKILHELRRGRFTFGRTALPPVYYGTVDATSLWVCLLADAWRWGMAESVVAELLPAAERALDWMADYGDGDGDGFLEYADRSGRGLTNQGWKDSGDSVRFADGRIASGPVALAEVQAYAYEAAVAGAEILDAFGRAGADRWRDYAARLAAAFRERFWVSDELGPYPALALDGDKRSVDAPASNMGHLLSSGMLTAEEAACVADRLVHPSMFSGFGLRTMSSEAGGYSPLSYHCGTVWPHDTAIAIHGLIRRGFTEQAAILAEGLLAAGTAFDGRLPELYGGFDRRDLPAPVPYPAACRPQAWAAAAAVAIVQAVLGLEADVPNGVVRVAPSTRMGAVTVSGLRVAGSELRVAVTADGVGSAQVAGPGLRVEPRDSALGA